MTLSVPVPPLFTFFTLPFFIPCPPLFLVYTPQKHATNKQTKIKLVILDFNNTGTGQLIPGNTNGINTNGKLFLDFLNFTELKCWDSDKNTIGKWTWERPSKGQRTILLIMF